MAGYTLNYSAIIQAANTAICDGIKTQVQANAATIIPDVIKNLSEEMTKQFNEGLDKKIKEDIAKAFDNNKMQDNIAEAINKHISAATNIVIRKTDSTSFLGKLKGVFGRGGSRRYKRVKKSKTRKLRKTKRNRKHIR